jgi:hypothetical protein
MCQTDAECDDGNGCTHDACVNGTCVHVCICLTPEGGLACCPGPAALCPPPPPTTSTTIPTGCGTCFDTIEMRCTAQACSASMPCDIPNEFCSSAQCPAPCPGSTTTTTTLPGGACQTDADCNDNNPCSRDLCVNGVCTHECLCLSASGDVTCCAGPCPVR